MKVHTLTVLIVFSLGALTHAENYAKALNMHSLNTVATPLSDGTVIARVQIFQSTDYQNVAIGVEVDGLSSGTYDSSCTANNGCGVHIHSGTSCHNSTTQGGHLYDTNMYNSTTDPWREIKYTNDQFGGATDYATFGGQINMGNVGSVEGKVFVIHDSVGIRVACGTIVLSTPENLPDFRSSSGLISPFGNTQLIEGSVTINSYLFPTRVGSAPNFNSIVNNYVIAAAVYVTGAVPNTNSAGAHVHNGTSCDSVLSQGGHRWSGSPVTDPWDYNTTIYQSGSDGSGWYIFFQKQYDNSSYYGISDSFPFVLHNQSTGNPRIGCGMLSTTVAPTTAGPESDVTSLTISSTILMAAFLASL